jgi:hypothetical protein
MGGFMQRVTRQLRWLGSSGARGCAAAGATVGGVAGALVGLGIPEIEAKTYEGKIRGGNILVAVHVQDTEHEKRTKSLFEKSKAHDIVVTGDSSVPHTRRAATHT